MKSNFETYKVKIISESAGPFLKIKLFDATDNLIISSYNVLEISLSKGLYIAKSEIDGVTGEEIVLRCNSDIEISIKAPVFYSSALIEGYHTSHEYYTYPSISESSIVRTFIDIPKNKKSGSLFIFFRFSSLEDLNKNNIDFHESIKLSLLDKNQNFLTSLDNTNAGINIQTGWICFNISLPVGTYYLRDESDITQVLMTVVHVFNNEQTQFFCFLDHKTGKPVHNTARIFVSDGPYSHDSEVVKIIDVLYLKLYKQDSHVGDFLIRQDFTKAPWNNPIIILQTLYLYSRGNKKEHKDLFLKLVKHFQENHVCDEIDSDLECIKLNENIFSLKELDINVPPPMLHFGISILANISSQKPGFISSKNIIHQISKSIIADSVITTFNTNALILLNNKEKGRKKIKFVSSLQTPITEKLNEDWVTASMIEIISNKESIGNSQEAAKILGVTDHIIANSIQELNGMMKDKNTKDSLKTYIELNLGNEGFEKFNKNIDSFK